MLAVTRDLKLASGEIVQVGMNFYAMSLMTKFPGGFGKLQAALNVGEDDNGEVDVDAASGAMDAFAYLFWALIRAGGKVCTVEECSMAIGFEDFEPLSDIMEEFSKSAKSIMPKNPKGRARQK
ncbi:hypothetical protein LJC74_03890 [Eubacteriales bacterium OttesenSCG-928-A19]|nr:hypothetical protein [Eubacteriales bacterium OttesenSCG-928-A19]